MARPASNLVLLTLFSAAALEPRQFPAPYRPLGGTCNTSAHEYVHEGKRCCTKCPPGEYAADRCTETRNTICRACPINSFNPMWHTHFACIPCTPKCKGDLVEKQPCGPKSPRICQCKPGYRCQNPTTYPKTCQQCLWINSSTKDQNTLTFQPTSSLPLTSCAELRVFNSTSGECITTKHCLHPGTTIVDKACEQQKSWNLLVPQAMLVLLLLSVLTLLVAAVFFHRGKVKVPCLKKVISQRYYLDWKPLSQVIFWLHQSQAAEERLNKLRLYSFKGNENHLKDAFALHHPLCDWTGSDASDPLPLTPEELLQSPAESNRSTENAQQVNMTAKSDGVLGSLHIYNPSTVFIGYITTSANSGPLLEEDNSEDGLKYPKQEENLSVKEESSTPQQEMQQKSLFPIQEESQQSQEH